MINMYYFKKEVDVVIEEEGGIIFDKENEKIYGIDFAGVTICNALLKKFSVKEIINIVCEKYKISYETAKNDVIEFIDSLVENGILQNSIKEE